MTDTAAGAATPEDEFVDGDPDTGYAVAAAPIEPENVSPREWTQRRLLQGRNSLRDVAVRARSSAPLPRRQAVETAGDLDDAPAVTLADRVQAYRAHLVGAAVAVIVLAALLLRRRAPAHPVEGFVNLGEWRVHVEAVPE